MIIARNLTKSFGNVDVINGISIEIGKEFLGIVGESGSGKSTLLYMLSGLLQPTSGNVSFQEFNISQAKDREMSKLRLENFGFVFQFHNLVAGLTVMENIETPLLLRQKNPRKYREDLHSLINTVGLLGYANRDVKELSGGQKQRVAIARALVNNPSVIFADEPTGSLDSQNSENVMELFSRLNAESGVSIIMVTHSEKTLKYCDRVINIVDGRIEKSLCQT